MIEYLKQSNTDVLKQHLVCLKNMPFIWNTWINIHIKVQILQLFENSIFNFVKPSISQENESAAIKWRAQREKKREREKERGFWNWENVNELEKCKMLMNWENVKC